MQKVKFRVVADTDIGKTKQKNQDSLLVKHACHPDGTGEVLLAVLCDGMGGLSRGEQASAAVIRAFESWFAKDFRKLVEQDSLSSELILEQWSALLEYENQKMRNSSSRAQPMGTTCTAVLLIENTITMIHVGDTRLYRFGENAKDGIQLTTDHTFVAGEIAAGRMTPSEAAVDRRRNLLTQCVGASVRIRPQMIVQPLLTGSYLLCSDGFRHEVSVEEMRDVLGHELAPKQMKAAVRQLIELGKTRGEKDNISAILIQTEYTDKRYL
ncbi:MAG: protein phosphatase 2C domain-containing protein [Eubacteriales bacterium]|nr:protein phosphatase 2C domain-containing protein [Eubacteriales bacterium]